MRFAFFPALRAALAVGVLYGSAAAHATELTVEVANLKSNAGRVLVALFNSAQGFPRTNYWRGEDVAAGTGTVRVVFRDVPEGTYAVTAMHDLDNNRKLKTNGLGIPIEPLAFSNGASGVDGPPTFADASFKVSGSAKRVTLRLK